MRALLPLLVILGLSACGGGEANTPSPAASSVAVSAAPELVFPHPAGFDEEHGAATKAFGDTCASCHREDASGAPTCASCHEGYPHAEGWLAGEVHGPAQEAACQDCHAATTEATPACTDCHGSYPHPVGWEAHGTHGAYAVARGSAEAACGSCHGASLEGKGEATGCTDCHEGYPHPSDWPSSHQAADTSTCTACHGDLGEGGVSAVSCARCHPGFPHPEDQLRQHMVSGTLRGEATCMGCHDPGDGPEAMPAGCSESCHGPASSEGGE